MYAFTVLIWSLIVFVGKPCFSMQVFENNDFCYNVGLATNYSCNNLDTDNLDTSRNELSCVVTLNNNCDMPNVLAQINNTYPSENIKRLLISLNTTWKGVFPLTDPQPVDITNLKCFRQLEWFVMLPTRDHANFQVMLKFEPETFSALRSLQNITINVALQDRNFSDMLAPLSNLSVLDLKYTHGISYLNMSRTLMNLSTNIEELNIAHFQTIGQNGYNTYVNSSHFFGNKTYNFLRDLDISYNGFALIHPGFSQVFPNLTTVNVSHNLLTADTNTPVMFEILVLKHIQQITFGYQGVENYVDFSSNQERTPMQRVSLMELLAPVTPCVNRVTAYNISNLFNPNNDSFCFFVKQCIKPAYYNMPCGSWPPLKEIYDYTCPFAIKFPIGPNVKSVEFNYLYLESSLYPGINVYNPLCFANNTLESLNMDGNKYWLGDHGIDSANAFLQSIYTSALKSVSLSNNRLESLSWKPLCINDSNVESIDVSFNKITNTSRNILTTCQRLQRFIMAYNIISVLDLIIPPSLVYLDLSGNNISTLSSEMIHQIEHASEKLKVNLSGNPIRCGCYEKAFIKTMLSSNHEHWSADPIRCLSYTGEVVALKKLSYHRVLYHCHRELLLSLCMILCFLFFVALALAFKYRYLIKIRLIKLRRALCRREEDDELNQYDYDAFVSYSCGDRFWVHDVLLRTLENTYGLKLVIHYRDFRPGENISTNISGFIEKSREVIVVLSEESLKSNWCRFELDVAHTYAIRRGCNVIVIKLGDLPDNIEHGTARTILAMNNYLEWKTTKEGQNAFWARLVSYLYGEDPICCCVKTRFGYEELRGIADD